MYEEIGIDLVAGQLLYKKFLSNLERFERALKKVLKQYPRSCEHFLSNEHINRIAWLGQSSMFIDSKMPCMYRGGFKLLSKNKQKAADDLAEKYLNIWLDNNEK